MYDALVPSRFVICKKQAPDNGWVMMNEAFDGEEWERWDVSWEESFRKVEERRFKWVMGVEKDAESFSLYSSEGCWRQVTIFRGI